MTTANSSVKGLLSKEAARKSVFANLVDLYNSDLAFRGMTDFAIIGLLAMMFLDPPRGMSWPWSGGGSVQPSAPGYSRPAAPDNMLRPNGIVPGSGPGAAVAIPFPDWLRTPRIANDFVVEVDRQSFGTSSAADQPRLAAARTALANWNPDGMVEALRQADASDANVALLRGIAFAIRGTTDANQTAIALLRQAAGAGSIPAKAMLGRLLMRLDTAASTEEGRQLIEAAAASGDRQAMRLAGIGYLSGEFGVLNSAMAADLLKKAADAGDAHAMALYANLLSNGIGVGSPDRAQAERYLRQSANAGLTLAQLTLGEWLKAQYAAGLLPDPKEAIAWLRVAYEKGHSLTALLDLVDLHRSVAKSAPWQDIARAMAYLRLCTGFDFAPCQFDTAVAWKNGYFGTVNNALARVHLQIALSLQEPRAVEAARSLDRELSQAQIAEAVALEPKIRAELQSTYPLVPLQYSDVAIEPAGEAISSDVKAVTGLPDIRLEKPQEGPAPSSSNAATNGDVNALRTRARKHMQDKDYDSAIADFTDIIRQGNATWEDYNQRGMAHHSKHELEPAMEDYDRAIAHNEHAAATYYNRSLIYMQNDKLDKALAEMNRALSEDNTWATYYITRGDVYFRMENYRAAIDDYNKYNDLVVKDASASNDDKALGFLMRGKAEVQAVLQGCNRMLPPDTSCKDATSYASAILDLQQALAAKPDYPEAHFQLGWIEDKLGNKRKAIESYTYALKGDPNNSTAYNNRGVIYGDMGQRDLALADYNDAIRTNPQNQFAWANRGMLFIGTRRGRKQAISDLRQSLAIDPNYDYAVRALRKLGVRP
jgi:tetratricopeptide (TPR) repeat protein